MNRSIIVVNDDITQLCVVSGMLERHGYAVTTCVTAEDAFRVMAASAPPSLIITDIQMPGIDGWQFCRIIRSGAHPELDQVPILAVSAVFMSEEAERLTREIGADGFLSVPYDAETLFRRADSLISGVVQRPRKRALVVRRILQGQKSVESLLDANEFEVHVVNYLGDVGAKVREWVPDMVFFEGFPVGETETLISGLRRFRSELPIVTVLPANAQPSSQTRLMRAGADACIRHPFDPEFLVLIAERTLREHTYARAEELLKNRSTELAETAEKYRSMMESLSDAVYIAGADFQLEYINPVMERLVGQPVLLNNPCYQTLSGRSSPCPWCRMADVQDGKTCRFEVESSHHGMWLNVSATPLRHPDGSISHIGILRDVSHEKMLVSQLVQAQKLEAIGKLSGGIAHDFNNMLGAILGYADIIRESNLDNNGEPANAALAKRVETIISASHRAATLVRQLLAFSRQGKAQNIPVDVHKIMHDVAGFIRSSMDKRINVAVRLSASNPTIQGDPALVQTALVSLAVNARDAMPKGGEILLTTSDACVVTHTVLSQGRDVPQGEFVAIELHDNGERIDPEVLDKLSDPFAYSKKGRGRSASLALASVYGAVEMHGGHVEVESSTENGTTFRIYLPVAVSPEKCIAPVARQAPVPGHILVVDDEAALRTVAVTMLQSMGHTVSACSGVLEAVRCFRDSHDTLDLVILDMMMPDGTGFDCFAAMKVIDPGVTAILATGYGTDAQIHKALSEGVCGLVNKPYDAQQLGEAVEAAMGRKARV